MFILCYFVCIGYDRVDEMMLVCFVVIHGKEKENDGKRMRMLTISITIQYSWKNSLGLMIY